MRYWNGYQWKDDHVASVETCGQILKFGCSVCDYTWREPDRDDMIVTPDHISCEGSGEPAVVVEIA